MVDMVVEEVVIEVVEAVVVEEDTLEATVLLLDETADGKICQPPKDEEEVFFDCMMIPHRLYRYFVWRFIHNMG